MSKRKYKRIELEKAEALIQKMWEDIEIFETESIDNPLRKLDELKLEFEYLKSNGNIISEEIGVNQYLENQKKIKELPNDLVELQTAINKAKEEKEKLRINYGISIAEQIKKPIYEEINIQMKELQKELFEHLVKVAEVCTEIKNILREYNEVLCPVLNTTGVYMTIPRIGYMVEVGSKFGLSNDIVNIKLPNDVEEVKKEFN